MNMIKHFNSGLPDEKTGHLEPPRILDPRETLRANFSGYPACSDSRLVVELNKFYSDPAFAEDGEPISGDETARFRRWHQSGWWPTYGDIPDQKPRGALF